MENLGTDFWVALFEFLGTAIAAVAGLITLYFKLRNKSNETEASLRAGNERLRAEYNAVLIQDLHQAVRLMLPVLTDHTAKLNEFSGSIELFEKYHKTLSASTKDFTGIARELSKHFTVHREDLGNVKVLFLNASERFQKIETELHHLKSGNIYVKTKK